MAEQNDGKNPTEVRVTGDSVGPDEEVVLYEGKGPADVSASYNTIQGGGVTAVRVDGEPEGDITARTEVETISDGGKIVGVSLGLLGSRKKDNQSNR